MATHFVPLDEAKRELRALIDDASYGDDSIITEAEAPIARLAPPPAPRRRRQASTARGLIIIHDDCDEPLADFAACSR